MIKNAQKTQEQQWQEWAAQSQKGDKKSYNALLKSLLPYIQNSLKPKCANPDWVDDITQNILLSIHKALHTYSADRPFKPWLISIINFRYTDYLRSHYRKQKTHTDTDDQIIENSNVTNPAHAGEYKDIESALKTLPEKQRIIFLKTKIEGYSIKEVAKDLNMSQSAVKTSAHRTQARLKEILGN